MTDILNTIAERTLLRVSERKAEAPAEEVRRKALKICSDPSVFPFEEALKKTDITMICEVKKASPSKGVLDEEFPYLKIAKEYEEAGADAISVLTEPYWFLGSDEYLSEIKRSIGIPVLRKDFTVDSYQIYEAKLLGADAVLLICALLEQNKLAEYIGIAHSLGLSAVVETHTEEEVRNAVEAGARIIGVNNRDLKTFQVDIGISIRLRSLVPDQILFISESGIKTPGDIAKLKDNKVDGVLIGETLMKSSDKKRMVAALKGCQ